MWLWVIGFLLLPAMLALWLARVVAAIIGCILSLFTGGSD